MALQWYWLAPSASLGLYGLRFLKSSVTWSSSTTDGSSCFGVQRPRRQHVQKLNFVSLKSLFYCISHIHNQLILSTTLCLRRGLFKCLLHLHGMYLKWLMRTNIPGIRCLSFTSFKKGGVCNKAVWRNRFFLVIVYLIVCIWWLWMFSQSNSSLPRN